MPLSCTGNLKALTFLYNFNDSQPTYDPYSNGYVSI